MTPEERRELLTRVLTPKPAWTVRALITSGRGKARHTVGELHGHLPAGHAATAEEAVAHYRQINPAAGALELRAFQREPRAS